MKASIIATKVLTRKGALFEAAQERQKAEGEVYRDWWAPVWQGLVLDREGRHYRQMGSAIWLFAYFILCADRQTGSLRRKMVTISRQMGVKTRTVRAWLRILRQVGYIETVNSGRSLLIKIRKWKTYPRWQNSAYQSDIILPGRVAESCQAEVRRKGRISAELSQKSAAAKNANDITLNKYIFKNVNVGVDKEAVDEENASALEICQAFRDEDNLPLYQSYVGRYPKDLIQKAYQEAIKLPANKIKKTRGAFFTYLVKHYAQEKNNHQDHGH